MDSAAPQKSLGAGPREDLHRLGPTSTALPDANSLLSNDDEEQRRGIHTSAHQLERPPCTINHRRRRHRLRMRVPLTQVVRCALGPAPHVVERTLVSSTTAMEPGPGAPIATEWGGRCVDHHVVGVENPPSDQDAASLGRRRCESSTSTTVSTSFSLPT